MALDHLAVAPAGVFVVDAKPAGRRLAPGESPAPRHRRAVGPEHGHEKVLAHDREPGPRDRAGCSPTTPVPVAPALCLVDPQGGEPPRSFMLDGVWVGTPPALPELVGHAGLLDREAMRTVVARLDARLG